MLSSMWYRHIPTTLERMLYKIVTRWKCHELKSYKYIKVLCNTFLEVDKLTLILPYKEHEQAEKNLKQINERRLHAPPNNVYIEH